MKCMKSHWSKYFSLLMNDKSCTEYYIYIKKAKIDKGTGREIWKSREKRKQGKLAKVGCQSKRQSRRSVLYGRVH